MGAPRRWIKQLLGLKKSEKIVSSEEDEKSSGAGGKIGQQSKKCAEIEKGVFENELNENMDTDFEDANWQWDMDQSSAPSTWKNAAQLPQDSRREEHVKDGSFQSDDMPASPEVQNEAQRQQDWREEWMGGIYSKEANFQSAADSPTSPEVEGADQLEQDTGEGWATPDVREMFDSDPDPSGSPSRSHQGSDRAELAAKCIQTVMRGYLLQNGAKAQLPMTEESAAICIQTVYRGFLAKRAFRALKGLTRLQAQVKGRILKRQTAIALRCIQALVKVQARSRAKHVLGAVEGQAVQQKLLQQLEHEAPVKKAEPFTYNGWCDKVGSAREVQARMLKRKEAAAKREKAKAYALARQWQAGIRQQPQQQQQQQQQLQAAAAGFPPTAGFPPDKEGLGWNWLERWMSVRPWETQFLGDASLRDGLKSPKMERGGAMDVATTPLFSTERRPMSSIANGKLSPRISNTIKVSTDGCTSSPRKLGNVQETPTTPVSSKSPRTPGKDSRPTIGSRSFSTPRERSSLSDNQDKKRLSLPGTMHGARLLAQTAINSPRTQSPRTLSPRTQSPRTPQKPGNPRTKLNGNEVKTSKLSR